MSKKTENEQSVSEKLADFIVNTEFPLLPANTVAMAKERVLDTIGACIAGSRGWDYSQELVQGLKELGLGEASVFSSKERLSCPAAAMVNSAYGHALELDDGHKNAGVHAGTVVVPTALAVGETVHASGRDLLTAIVLGYEIVYRIACSINPAQIKKGFHPSATCGVFGAAAAAAKLLGLNRQQTANALGLAGMQAAGLMEATLSGQGAKCVMVGHASLAGVISARLAKEGLPGPSSVFEGRYGLFNTMSENVLKEDLFKELGKTYEIADTYVKLYPSCRHIHPAIESILSLQEDYRFSVQEISKVVTGTHEVAVNLTGHIYVPEDAAEARFSLPYIIAVALREGTVGIRHLGQEYLLAPEIRETARLVEVKLDEEVNGVFPARRGARVQVMLKDGRVLEKTTYILKGSPDLPVGWHEIYNKFLECAAGVADPEKIEELVTVIRNLEELSDVNEIMKCLC